jgi:RNA polymerase sigma-70 factor (ECF subfamily)
MNSSAKKRVELVAFLRTGISYELLRDSMMEMATVKVAPSEAELIHRILSGDRELYCDLIAPYERMVYVSALSLLHNEIDAEDCAQEAFLKAFRHLNEFKGESKFGSWLIRIALNEAKMRIRKMRADLYDSLDKVVPGEEDNYIPQVFGDWRELPSEALERKEIRDLLEKAVQSLPEKYRVVLVLREIQNLDVATTAQILGVSEAVVKTRLLRARVQMKDLLAPVLKNSRVFSRNPFKKGRNPWL